jgi:hypothetical protein
MPTNETLELYAALRGELRLPVAQLVINGVVPRLFPGELASVATRLPSEAPPDSALAGLLTAGRRRALREQIQADYISRLQDGIPVPTTVFPYLFVPDFRRAAVESLSFLFG